MPVADDGSHQFVDTVFFRFFGLDAELVEDEAGGKVQLPVSPLDILEQEPLPDVIAYAEQPKKAPLD